MPRLIKSELSTISYCMNTSLWYCFAHCPILPIKAIISKVKQKRDYKYCVGVHVYAHMKWEQSSDYYVETAEERSSEQDLDKLILSDGFLTESPGHLLPSTSPAQPFS